MVDHPHMCLKWCWMRWISVTNCCKGRNRRWDATWLAYGWTQDTRANERVAQKGWCVTLQMEFYFSTDNLRVFKQDAAGMHELPQHSENWYSCNTTRTQKQQLSTAALMQHNDPLSQLQHAATCCSVHVRAAPRSLDTNNDEERIPYAKSRFQLNGTIL